MDANIARAAGAYQNNINIGQGLGSIGSIGSLEGGQKPASFSDMLGDVLHDAVDTSLKAESMQMQALTGEVELADLVTAIAEAELTLNTVVSVRDRVIAAYQEIIRMPI